MRVLIVGAGGQDGSILWQQLQQMGDELLGIMRSAVTTSWGGQQNAIDVRNADEVRHLMEEFFPDRIYFLVAHHHSSQDPAIQSEKVWKASWETHVESFRNFLEAIRICGLAARIFYASSSRVFGAPDISPQTEDTPLKPACIYGITKATGMMLARYYRDVHGVWASCGILYNHESPLRGNEFVSQKVVRGLVAVKRGTQSHLEVGSLNSQVDWGYAPDYTHAMRLILEAPQPADFVVATGRLHSVREMIEIAAECIGVEWRKIVVENPTMLQRPSPPLCGDASRLRATVGWKPQESFEGMVKKMARAAESG